MSDVTLEKIQEAVNKVEHPEIALPLVELGMVRDVEYHEEDGTVSLTMVLPMLGIPEAVRNYMANSLYEAIKAVGAELKKVKLTEMTEEERQAFFQKEHSHWRG